MRINLTLEGPVSMKFKQVLKECRMEEINKGKTTLTSASKMVNALLNEILPTAPKIYLKNIGISVDAKGRGTIRLPKNAIQKADIRKGDRINLIVSKHKM